MTTKKKGGTDHEMVVGRLGIGFFGTAQLPAGFDANGATLVSAPQVGMRMWFVENLGIEGAIGFALSSGSVDNDGTSVDLESVFGLAFHVGLPLSFYYGEHYNFMLIPEINVGFADGSVPVAGNGDTLISGFNFGVGARIGAEIQFGFIDIPELALQGTVGLGFQFQSATNDVCNPDPAASCNEGSTQSTLSRVGLGTTVQAEPWDIFTGNIAAIYYF